ncbi:MULTISPECIES: GIY-YIG nuclease family protein [Rhodococcus]|uniref:GIY-YIG nuclease family protein n=1 Tax=Rhodococcus TaxID=1827 RepID=UPI000A956821|nr:MULTISPECIES: GIY-YIG nuclease family protein [Rhodococcus]RZL26233.1 MAG: GIY-YIG nuclease family protein [Rhodococcus sp. (in: high G+C Gram-positive bacteria)]
MAIVWTVPRGISPTLLVAPLIKEFLAEGEGTLDSRLSAVGIVCASLEKQVGRTFTSISSASAAIFSGAAASSSVPDALRLAVMRTLSTEVLVRKPAPQPFSEKVGKRLGEYVFALRDPRNNQVFHVGHGTGNQVFASVFEALGELDNLEGASGSADTPGVTAAKISRIREIYDAGSAVEHYVLIRSVSGADASGTADAVVSGIVETLRISEAGENLTNLAGEVTDKDLRATRVEEIALRYSADPAPELPTPSVVLHVPGSARAGATAEEIYELARQEWAAGAAVRAEAGIPVLVFADSIIRGAFRAQSWEVSTRNADGSMLWRFTGDVDEELAAKYVGTEITPHNVGLKKWPVSGWVTRLTTARPGAAMPGPRKK